MTTVTLPVPDSLTEAQARLLYAIQLFEDDVVSSGKAAEIAAMSREDFILELGRREIAVVNHDADDAAKDIANARSASRR